MKKSKKPVESVQELVKWTIHAEDAMGRQVPISQGIGTKEEMETAVANATNDASFPQFCAMPQMSDGEVEQGMRDVARQAVEIMGTPMPQFSQSGDPNSERRRMYAFDRAMTIALGYPPMPGVCYHPLDDVSAGKVVHAAREIERFLAGD